ncbi:xanthine dehydrogenase accessory protein XdhC [Marinibacterium profundimaris]|uniref:Molybdenum cofactor sulfurylase n=1 Tax=Marinibacterium profundimaris TaxID=1679460 RepID=A0A225NHC0_9RHOB|nr:xanthine dehydrogenase accessory protein XdhC [Marinibacterium profundimaris]OWU70363.1 molybdenum cofactor sulfurylase [Marinibacterium profundimaris]
MAFEIEALRRALARGPVWRVVVAEVKGSAPREVGAAMLVWDGGQSGTIGGGALEFEAAEAARAGRCGLSRQALGPDLGQCCGGAVTLLTERFVAEDLARIGGEVFARPVAADGPVPLAVERILARARDRGEIPAPLLVDGWMVEPVAQAARPLWIWGAGHVGRALVDVLAPLPDLAITWVDTGPERFPETIPEGVTMVPAAAPAALVPRAPKEAEHLILTYSHALDLELCHALLLHGFAFAGLIGSATKWARFRSRLAGLGHGPEQIARITCPIGDPSLGKHPQAIALGVGAQLLAPLRGARREVRA